MPWKQIVAKAVHDMRTPLSCMRTTVEILRLLPTDSDQRRGVIGSLETQIDLIARQLELLMASPESFLVKKAGEGT